MKLRAAGAFPGIDTIPLASRGNASSFMDKPFVYFRWNGIPLFGRNAFFRKHVPSLNHKILYYPMKHGGVISLLFHQPDKVPLMLRCLVVQDSIHISITGLYLDKVILFSRTRKKNARDQHTQK